MKVGTAPMPALWMWLVATSLLLGGCSSLPLFGDGSGDAKAASAAGSGPSAASAGPAVPLYRFEVVAPAPLRKLLLDYLDLSRFQNAPRSEGIAGAELDRLAAAAPAQARTLLETEGYFNADVGIVRSTGTTSGTTLGVDGDVSLGGTAAGATTGSGASSDDVAMPRLVMTVVPGPRVTVSGVSIAAIAPLAARISTRDQPWTDRLEKLRQTWSLPAGQPFRDAAWTSAKNASLGELRADGYPTASWQSTHARIDATDNTAALDLLIDGGPIYRLGALRIEGIERYDAETVRRLATFSAGDVYSEKLLLDYQERIAKVGLFDGASVELDASGSPDAAPVVVKVKELTRQQATFGIGYSANTGPRVSVEHFDRKVFGQPFIAHSTFTFGPDLKSLGTEFTSYPRADLWHDLAAANVEQLRASDETRDSWTARVGRSQDNTRYERLYYLEAVHARVESAPLTDTSTAVSVNYNWLRRDVDNILAPSVGTALTVQGGIGYGNGTETRTDLVGELRSRGPFARAYTRFSWYRPFGGWLANARVEGGEVFVHDRIGVPDTILFRAGGDNSVRGYGYRTLGPTVNGAVVGGRVMLTGSAEVEHPLTDRLPALLGALFVDAGNAADRWNEIRPVVGFGAGLHYRSPVGPLRIDLAYGEHVRQLRLHLSVGVAF